MCWCLYYGLNSPQTFWIADAPRFKEQNCSTCRPKKNQGRPELHFLKTNLHFPAFPPLMEARIAEPRQAVNGKLIHNLVTISRQSRVPVISWPPATSAGLFCSGKSNNPINLNMSIQTAF